MIEAVWLRDLVVLLAAAIPIVFIFQKLSIPSIVGFLLAGVILGPHGAGVIASAEEVERIAELGVILLLFVIGLELSVGGMIRAGRAALLTGALQVLVTGAIVTGLAAVAGLPAAEAVFIGFLLVHSSTAVALKILSDRGQTDALQGRLATSIAIFQDLCLVPMMLLVPVLAARQEMEVGHVLTALLQAGAVVVAIVAVTRLVFPAVLRQVARLRIGELFTGTVVLFCLGTAWLAGQLGLSLAFGALIAGLVISESDYSHQVVAQIVPFRDTFSSLFFMSIGMLLHVDFLFAHIPQLALAVTVLVALKAGIIAFVVRALQGSLRVAVVVGVCLGQIGELAFVLARFALPYELLPETHYAAFVAVAVLSMLVTPLLVTPVERLAFRLQGWFGSPEQEGEPGADHLSGHVLIIGYGLNGRNLARVLRETGLAYRVVELNADIVTSARREREPILFGDATRPEVLRAAGVAWAHVIVVAISDPVSTRRIVALARERNPRATLIIRTRYVAEIDELYRLGASEVIPEEFETSVEIFARVLRRMHVPRNIITLQVDLIRQERYGMLRGLRLPQQSLSDIQQILAATLTETVLIQPGSPADGGTIRDIGLRERAGVTIIAVVREGRALTNPAAGFQIAGGDVLVLLGSHAELDRALEILSPPAAGASSLATSVPPKD